MTVTMPEVQKTEKNRASEDLAVFLKMEQLPAMPHSALSVLQLDSDFNKININDIVRPIEADPGLAAQVLKFLNSAFFGFQNNISSIQQGIALAGFRIVKNFVLWKAVFSLMPKSEGGLFNLKHLWQDSLRRGIFARRIAKELGMKDQDTVFIGALLQDMAIPLLMKKKPQQYTNLIKMIQDQPFSRLSELEEKEFGWNHAQAAKLMCQGWKIPEELTVLIANHTQIEPFMIAPKENSAQLAVSISALLPTVTSPKWHEQSQLQGYIDRLFPGRPADTLEKHFVQVDEEFSQYASIMQITQPAVPLVNRIVK